MCRTRRGGPRTPSGTTGANLDCAFVENTPVFAVPKIGAGTAPLGPLPCPPPSPLDTNHHEILLFSKETNNVDNERDFESRPRDFDSPAFPTEDDSVLGFPSDQQFGQPPQQTTEDPFRRIQSDRGGFTVSREQSFGDQQNGFNQVWLLTP